MAHVTAYMNERFTVVTDAYSTELNLNLEYKQHTFAQKLVEIIKDSDVQKNNFEVDDIGISQVIDVWNEMKSVTASIDEGNIVYSGKYNVCILTQWAVKENRSILNAYGRFLNAESMIGQTLQTA
ncbi:MAG: hypothetical protein ACLTE2_11900 [Eubacteriales bacterium]